MAPGIQACNDSASLKTALADSNLVVIFSAVWCGPCVQFKKNLIDAGVPAAMESSGLKFVVVDVDEAGDLAEQYSIT